MFLASARSRTPLAVGPPLRTHTYILAGGYLAGTALLFLVLVLVLVLVLLYTSYSH